MNGGLYVLALPLPGGATATVGALGRLRLEAGVHLYVGSARRGLWQRVARHLRRDKPRRWHVDALSTHPALGRPWALLLPADPRAECALAAEVGRWVEARGGTPGPRGFGASDCACSTHLWRVDRAEPAELARALGRTEAPPGFAALRARGTWRPLRGCPGRWVRPGLGPAPDALLGPVAATAWRTDGDPALVAPVEGGGLVSWLRADGVLHTLGDAGGFARKLADLGLAGAA